MSGDTVKNLDFGTGNQLELTAFWCLNSPSSNAVVISFKLNAQIALPAIEFSGVVKTA